MKRIIPMLDRILIRRADVATTSPGGIVLTEKSRPKVTRGTVMAVGPGRTDGDGNRLSPVLRVGDIVLLPSWGGLKVADDEQMRLYRESDILGKFTNN